MRISRSREAQAAVRSGSLVTTSAPACDPPDPQRGDRDVVLTSVPKRLFASICEGAVFGGCTRTCCLDETTRSILLHLLSPEVITPGTLILFLVVLLGDRKMNILDLPPELVIHVMLQLDPSDVVACGQVSAVLIYHQSLGCS